MNRRILRSLFINYFKYVLASSVISAPDFTIVTTLAVASLTVDENKQNTGHSQRQQKKLLYSKPIN